MPLDPDRGKTSPAGVDYSVPGTGINGYSDHPSITKIEVSSGNGGAIAATLRDCSVATGADSKIARQEQGESTWDPLNASELAPNSANGLIPSLIAWAKSQPPGNVAIVSVDFENDFEAKVRESRKLFLAWPGGRPTSA